MAGIPETAQLRSDAAIRVDAWLGRFESALAAGDVDAAAGLFAPHSFWRDLIAFT
jgi:putative flavoprotein involved in K+ transport